MMLNITGQVPTPYRVNDYVQHRQERFQRLELTPDPERDGTGSSGTYVATILIER